MDSILRLRSELLFRLRSFFADRGFLEVETPLLASEVVIDRHVEPLLVSVSVPDLGGPKAAHAFWLQTSPEAHMKRLLADGAEAIFQITRSFRAAERGRLHNPEFTILEWYRSGDSMEEGISLLSELVGALLALPPATRLSYAAAFEKYVGLNPHAASEKELREAAALASAPEDGKAFSRDDLLDFLLLEKVEPHLGIGQPTVLFDYPASQAALAQVLGDDPPVAKRFEIYFRGIELANGYQELRDEAVLRERMEKENARRTASGKSALPMPEQLLEAMERGLPECTGVALGFDRLVMLAAGATSIDEVIVFPIERA